MEGCYFSLNAVKDVKCKQIEFTIDNDGGSYIPLDAEIATLTVSGRMFDKGTQSDVIMASISFVDANVKPILFSINKPYYQLK